jgi:hypothetical protein
MNREGRGTLLAARDRACGEISDLQLALLAGEFQALELV